MKISQNRPDQTIELRLNAPLLPILVGVVFVMQLVDPYQGWTILLVGLGGLWLVCYLWARLLADQVLLVRERRYGWAQVGDQLQERFTAVNNSPVPALWLEVQDHSTLPDYPASSVRAVDGRGTTRWYTKGLCRRRGLFRLGPTSLRTGDPFGIYTVHIHWDVWTDLMVTPPVIPLPSIVVAPGGRAGEGRPRPNTFERTVSVAGVRDHVPGDSLHLIHWPTTARRDSLYVRLFESTPSGDWWILLDFNQACQEGEGYHSTAEHGVMLAASLADRGLRAGRAVGLVANAAEPVWLAPQQGHPQRLRVLRELALLEPGERTLQAALARIPSGIARQASIILITPDVQGDWMEPLLPVVRRGATPTVLLLDPISFGGDRSPKPLSDQLTRLGITSHLITRDLLDLPEARPGREGQWEWRTTGTGRAVPVRKPSDMSWRELR